MRQHLRSGVTVAMAVLALAGTTTAGGQVPGPVSDPVSDQTQPAAAPSAAGAEAQPPIIYTGVVGIELRERGALLIDDFEGDEVDTSKWEVWHNNPKTAAFAVKDGRFEIRGEKRLKHNGLSSVDPAKFKDVTLVARMNIESDGDSPHDLLLHLCGGDMPTSPDHWVEITMRDIGNGQVRFGVDAAVEKGEFTERYGELILERGTEEGFLARLSLDASSNLCKTEVRDAQGVWHEVVQPIPLRLRTTHSEIKMRGGWATSEGAAPSTSVGWFKNVRMYPRAASNPVLFRLVLRDGTPIHYRHNGKWPPIVRFADAGPRDLEDLVVELWTADGATLISKAQSPHFAHYMLPVDHDAWEVFPVGALVRVSVDGQTLGEAAIPPEGLYPDDVYDVFME